jgi:DNA helicase IV
LTGSEHDQELRAEREYVARLYTRLDAERVYVTREMDKAMSDQSAGAQLEARWLRDAVVDTWADRRRRLRLSDNGLCFGRIDTDDDGPVHIGRIGLSDYEGPAGGSTNGHTAQLRPLLTDWRAPIARPFYTATGANPEGISLRRHFRTRGRGIVDFTDERFGPDAAGGAAAGTDEALLAAVNAARTDGMRDIVATIQAAQDEVIRLGSTGVVVIEGGPGTGKTAVALHRVAYLLYTHRERMARRGVLLVGPNPGFLDYVSGVLPALGETDVVFATLGTLMPGVRTTRRDTDAAAVVKGSSDMVGVLVEAVLDCQRIPDEPIDIPLDDVTLPLDAEVVGNARDAARASRLVHNQARAVFDHHVIEALTWQAVARIGDGWLEPPRPDHISEEVIDEFGEVVDEEPLAENLVNDCRAELAGNQELADALDELWPMLTPQRLLGDLLSSPERLESAGLSSEQAATVYRPDGRAWTVSDVPLLDELVDIIGSDGTEEPPEDDEDDEVEDPEEREYAEGVLEILDTEEDPDEEVLRAVDLLEAGRMAERQEKVDLRGLAERAAADRHWTYGHVVVDEAQELSEMDWRALMRRCPTRSMTIVGDLAQRESPAGARDWATMLDPFVEKRWAYRRLVVNYRTPADIMDVAARVLEEVDPGLRPPASVRRTGVPPWARAVAALDADELVAALTELAGQVGEGTVAVITPDGVELPAGWADRLPPAVRARLSELTPHGAKGLEFDAVLLCEPHLLLARSARGAADLYVALTRATQRLGVLHTAPLPAALSGLSAPRERVSHVS